MRFIHTVIHTFLSSQVTADDNRQREIPIPSVFPRALCCSRRASALGVNLTGQCCPTERQARWPGKHCPLVGLALTALTAPLAAFGSQCVKSEQVMGAGSINEQARDHLTKSSRLVYFCSSSDPSYGLNSSTGLTSSCSQCRVDQLTDTCLIKSSTYSFESLLPS